MDRVERVVLLVDDEEPVLRLAEAMAKRNGYAAIAAMGPLEALERSREFSGNIDLLLTDVTMPVIDGVTLARRVVAERPHTRVLLMSAYGDVQSRLPLLPKPFSMDEFLAAVTAAIDGPPPFGAEILPNEERTDAQSHESFAAELEVARQRHFAAAREFLEATDAEAFPHPDGILRLKRRRQRAFEEYEGAKKRFDEFIARQSGPNETKK
jgi:CheY-like chemotaxis protein